MKKRLNPLLKLARIQPPLTGLSEMCGWFLIHGPAGRKLLICSSNELGWDHVSVSVDESDETPTWDEMCYVKELFFDAEEPAVQYHPPKSRYVNHHPGCLHLWRWQGEPKLPMPPLILV